MRTTGFMFSVQHALAYLLAAAVLAGLLVGGAIRLLVRRPTRDPGSVPDWDARPTR